MEPYSLSSYSQQGFFCLKNAIITPHLHLATNVIISFSEYLSHLYLFLQKEADNVFWHFTGAVLSTLAGKS